MKGVGGAVLPFLLACNYIPLPGGFSLEKTLEALTPHSKAKGIVEKGRIGAVFSMAWAVAKQLAAVSLSPSIDSITSPRLYQET